MIEEPVGAGAAAAVTQRPRKTMRRMPAAQANAMPGVDEGTNIASLRGMPVNLTTWETAEVRRVLKSGGRAIFKEPVRDSPLVRRVRGWVPYRTPDVSPHERPLSAAEIAQFAMRFRSSSARAFCLPFVSVTHVVPPLQRYM